MKLMQNQGNKSKKFFQTVQGTVKALIIILAVYELWVQGAELAWIDPAFIGRWIYQSHYFVWGQFVPLEASTEIGHELMKLARIFHEFPRQIVLGVYLAFWAGVELLKDLG